MFHCGESMVWWDMKIIGLCVLCTHCPIFFYNLGCNDITVNIVWFRFKASEAFSLLSLLQQSVLKKQTNKKKWVHFLHEREITADRKSNNIFNSRVKQNCITTIEKKLIWNKITFPLALIVENIETEHYQFCLVSSFYFIFPIKMKVYRFASNFLFLFYISPWVDLLSST